LAQHEIAAAGDLIVHTYQEAIVDGNASLGDEAKTMRAGMKEKSLALRQKLGKLTAIANPELGDKFLEHVIFKVSFLFKVYLE
jgi:hypothetical protein